ncbi:MAG TPA: expansin EXLX1 family cellulose-binding protein, partial [Gammaproteobacteria bacterium]
SADTITSQPVAHANDNAPRRSVAASQPAPSPAPRYGTVQRGEATFYPATGSGNCSFEVSDDVMVAALNSRDYATAALCGAYLEVTGPAGTVIVRVTDRCPGCKAGGLDLSRQAFARIATTQAGRVPVTWQIVAGPVAGPLTYRYMDGSTRYWTAIQVRNHRWPIAALAIKPGGASDWIAVERRAYNYFVYPKPIASGPLQLRVTALSGATMEDELPEPAGGVLVQGAAQFD